MKLLDLDKPAVAGAADSALLRYWQRARRLTGWLLLIWAGVGFGLVYFARALNGLRFFGWPFGFWIAAQGALLVFCALIAYYAHAMRKLDEASDAANGRDG